MIDWWSLGVCAFELMFGRRPFRGRTNPDLTHSISRDPIRFPEDSDSKCSKEGKMALKDVRLLSRELGFHELKSLNMGQIGSDLTALDKKYGSTVRLPTGRRWPWRLAETSLV